MIYVLAFLAVFAVASLIAICFGARQYRLGPDGFDLSEALAFAAMDYAYGFLGIVRGIRDFIVIAASFVFTLTLAAVLLPVPYLVGLIVSPVGHLVECMWSCAKDGYAKGGKWFKKAINVAINPADDFVHARGW